MDGVHSLIFIFYVKPSRCLTTNEVRKDRMGIEGAGEEGSRMHQRKGLRNGKEAKRGVMRGGRI
jgi:hypothetical protein